MKFSAYQNCAASTKKHKVELAMARLTNGWFKFGAEK